MLLVDRLGLLRAAYFAAKQSLPDGIQAAAAAALAALHGVPGGEQAAEIGEVRTEPPGMVLVETAFGGRRVMDQLVGDPLPRIC
jgi:hydrogenase maturation factor